MYINVFKVNREELIKISPNDIGGSSLTPDALMRLMAAQGILFSYDFVIRNNVKSLPPHAVLLNGKHTDFYVQLQDLCRSTYFTAILGSQLAKKLSFGRTLLAMSPRQRREEKPVWVVGPSYGSAFLVAAIARELQAQQALTRRVEAKDQEWQGSPIPSGSLVQLVDDVMYTASSILAARNALLEPLSAKSKVLIKPEVGVVINMSGLKKVEGMKIISLLEPEQRLWQPEVCELCEQGSKALSVQYEWAQLAESCWWNPPEEPGKYNSYFQ